MPRLVRIPTSTSKTKPIMSSWTAPPQQTLKLHAFRRPAAHEPTGRASRRPRRAGRHFPVVGVPSPWYIWYAPVHWLWIPSILTVGGGDLERRGTTPARRATPRASVTHPRVEQPRRPPASAYGLRITLGGVTAASILGRPGQSEPPPPASRLLTPPPELTSWTRRADAAAAAAAAHDDARRAATRTGGTQAPPTTTGRRRWARRLSDQPPPPPMTHPTGSPAGRGNQAVYVYPLARYNTRP